MENKNSVDNSTVLYQPELIILAETIERALNELSGTIEATENINGRQYEHLLSLQTQLNFMLRWAHEKANHLGIHTK